MNTYEKKQYDIRNVVSFKKTTEKWGELSNMCAGFPVLVNGIEIRTVEALYQACRYPLLPDVQHKILSQGSPMTAKMVGKPYIAQTRPDWDEVRILMMKWSLRVKLIQNWEKFSNVLLETEDNPIVELSNKDDFWGAKPEEGNIYIGVNALGRLLMELREHIKQNKITSSHIVSPLYISNFLLYGKVISIVDSSQPPSKPESQLTMFDV
ncbi:NADAR family protein [uncultured Psychromonas sp.]|uniref:NADAR family protein n=1 Tax=uncultured Psychromonas sp. TaxID=173974 RepID=UPI002608C3B4|nr:NADAR family protein [uncultured Psychromonas sp.]